jgi:hypothetical protein
MTITISSTTKVVKVNGVDARVWEGETAAGVKIHCFITRIGVAQGQDTTQFETELEEQRAPSPEVEAIPLRMIL